MENLELSTFEAGEDPFLKHSALIWRQEGCTVENARFKAWLEGPDGYGKRLEQEMQKELDKGYEDL